MSRDQLHSRVLHVVVAEVQLPQVRRVEAQRRCQMSAAFLCDSTERQSVWQAGDSNVIQKHIHWSKDDVTLNEKPAYLNVSSLQCELASPTESSSTSGSCRSFPLRSSSFRREVSELRTEANSAQHSWRLHSFNLQVRICFVPVACYLKEIETACIMLLSHCIICCVQETCVIWP